MGLLNLGWWGWWWRRVQYTFCWGVLNISNHLAAFSLGTKIHAGAKLPRPSCRKRNNKERGICQICALLLPGQPLQHQLAAAPTQPQQSGGQQGGGGAVGQRGAQSRMQIPKLFVQMKILWVGCGEGGGVVIHTRIAACLVKVNPQHLFLDLWGHFLT